MTWVAVLSKINNSTLTFKVVFTGRLKLSWVSGILIRSTYGHSGVYYVSFLQVTLYFRGKIKKNRSRCLWKLWALLRWNWLIEALGLLSFSMVTYQSQCQAAKEKFARQVLNHCLKSWRIAMIKSSYNLSKSVSNGFRNKDSNQTRPCLTNGF